MPAGVLLDATPLAGAHALRGIGAAVAGLLSGFSQLEQDARPRLLMREGQDQLADFESRSVPWPEWTRYRVPDPWPRLKGERLTARREEAIFHATQPALVPSGPGVIVTLYDLIPAVYPEHYLGGIGRLPERRAYHRFLERASQAQLIIAISQETADDAVRLLDIPEQRITVIPLAQPKPAVPLGPAPDRSYVLYTGGLEHHKNVPLLIDALARTTSDVALVATGAWSDRRVSRLQRHARRAGVAERIEWRGHVSPGELEALRRGAIAQVIPSLKEGFGLPVLEAMGAETPVICSDTPALREVAADAATYLPVDQPARWAETIDEIANDPKYAREMTARGRIRAAEFSWIACAEATAAAYRSVASGFGA